MTPAPPHDRPAPNSSTEDSNSSQWSVGWALTAITFTVLVVGVAIIRQLSADPQSTESTAGAEVEISPKATTEQETPPRLVLRPEGTDSASIPLYQQDSLFQQGPLSKQGVPASWEQDGTSEESFILPAYR